jgi:MoaA/NifB/PqqE/SkfB family radical SAM enzyme
LLKDWLNFLVAPPFDWIQVEPTSNCNAYCLYCPRTVYRDSWLNRNLSLRDFERLVPAFIGTRMVFLQGWGEPFLNPDLFSMIQIAKKAGCRVGTTTNGILLDREIINKIIASGIDVLAISLAGLDQHNDSIRVGTGFNSILKAMNLLQEIKMQRGTKLPAVHIAYMLLNSGLEDINKLPATLQGLGISQVVVSTLDFVPSKILQQEAIIPDTLADFHKVYDQLASVKREGEKCDLEIHFQLAKPGNLHLSCTENIHRALFISAAGDISPCVYHNLPVSLDINICPDNKLDYHHVVFGNSNETGVAALWRGKNYKAFRKNFKQGRFTGNCICCSKLTMQTIETTLYRI